MGFVTTQLPGIKTASLIFQGSRFKETVFSTTLLLKIILHEVAVVGHA